MLVDSFAAVSLEAVDLPALRWAGIAKHLHQPGAPSASFEDISGEDGAGDPDAVACLRVSRSALASLRGLEDFCNLLALAVPRNGLTSIDCQVRCCALTSNHSLLPTLIR